MEREAFMRFDLDPPPLPPLHPIHPQDPAVTWSEEWKSETEKCIRAFGYQPSSINILRAGWEKKTLDNSILLLVYIEEAVDDNAPLANAIRNSCSQIAPDCPGLQVRVFQGEIVLQSKPHLDEQILELGRKITTDIMSGTSKTASIGCHILIRKNDQVKRAMITCHHAVSVNAEPLCGTEGLKVFCPSDGHRREAIRLLKALIEQGVQQEQTLQAQADRYPEPEEYSLQQDMNAATADFESFKRRLRDKQTQIQALKDRLDRWKAPKTDWQCGTVMCSSGLKNRTTIGGLSDWAVIEPAESFWPQEPNTYYVDEANDLMGFKITGTVPISALCEPRSLPIDMEDPQWDQCEVLRAGGTRSKAMAIVSGRISYVKSDIWLPDHANGKTKLSEWVVVPKKGGKVFSEAGDSGGAAITATQPPRLCGIVIGGTKDDRLTYISDAPETFEAIRECTGADEVLMA